MSGKIQAIDTRLTRALTGFTTSAINLDLEILGSKINDLIQDVGQLNVVSIDDLKIFGGPKSEVPINVVNALCNGTKFFDAIYYFALEEPMRTQVQLLPINPIDQSTAIISTKNRLLWTAIFLMLRGSYPESGNNQLGTDVPAFLRNICGMTESPANVAEGLASFPLVKINPSWIRSIEWSTFAAPIRQRLALGLAGYRQLGPFKLYNCQNGVSNDVQEAFEWVQQILAKPLDYAILSCTRSPQLIARLGSWNKALGNLMLQCFSQHDLQEMLSNKIIFALPIRDPRADTWRSWVNGGDLDLHDPIGL